MKKEHYITTTYVGPYVIAQCCCGEFHVRKQKQHSEVVASAARVHLAKFKPKERGKVYHDKYAEMASKVPEPSGEDIYEGYKRTQLLFGQESDTAIVQGGNLRHNAPRKEKHHRLTVGGLRVK